MSGGVTRLWDQHFNFLASEPTPDPVVRGSDLRVTIKGEGELYAATKAQIEQELDLHLTFDPDAKNLNCSTRIGGIVTKLEVERRSCECGNSQITTTSIRAYSPTRPPILPGLGSQP